MGSSSCWESCEVTTTVQAEGGALDLFLKNECSDSHVDRNRTHRHKPAQKARDAVNHTLEFILQCHDLNPGVILCSKNQVIQSTSLGTVRGEGD